MNKWALYFKEREGFETLETESAILSYKIQGQECYVRDIYVLPEARLSGAGTEIANLISELAKENGCTYLTGSVVPSTKGATGSMMAMLKYGFSILKSQDDFIILSKEL
jgi:GNAT superfamily N-acetyltransferase